MCREIRPHVARARWSFLLAAGLGLAAFAPHTPAYGRGAVPEPVADSRPLPPLRVLILRAMDTIRSHRDSAMERAMLRDFAATLGRPVQWIEALRPRELYDRLLRGEGDLVIGSLPPELQPDPRLAHSDPLATERYQLIGRMDGTANSPLDLGGLRIAARIASPLWSYLEHLRDRLPGVTLEALPAHLDRDGLLRLVADGRYDATVLPATDRTDLTDHPRLKSLFDLTGLDPVRWYVRAEDRQLLKRVNGFIERYHPAYGEPVAAPRDFRAIKARGVLRVITRVDPGNYYLANGKPAGYELELARAFAAEHGLRLEVLVGRTDEQLVEWLTNGAGDVITTRIDSRRLHGDPALRLSRRYHYTAYSLITPAGRPLRSPAQLHAQTLVAYADSPELRALETLRSEYPALRVIPVDPAVSREALLARVAAGEVNAVAVAGERVAETVGARRDLAVGASVPHHFQYRWTVRGDADDALLQAVGRFFRRSHAEGLDALLADRYFNAESSSRAPMPDPAALSPYDSIVQTYAERYGFDWRLIAAQIYQESQFDPAAVSRAGAAGLMQMLPSTARALGFTDLGKPEASIHAGVKYLYTLRNEFDDTLPASERTWFALAAYNGGRGQVERARRLAERLKLDPNKWFGNVETAMLRMARQSARGRRCGQAIIYVRAIQSLYGTYRYLQLSAQPGGVVSGLPPA